MPSPNQRLGGARMLEQLEEQEIEPRVVAPPAFPVEDDQRQRRRMVIALILLLVALGLVLVKDRDFWFPLTDTTAAESEPTDDATPVATVEAASTATPAAKPAIRTLSPSLSTAKRKQHSVASKAPETTAPATPTVTATRAVLPPLRVGIVTGGDQHLQVKPGSASVKVDLQPGTVVPPLSDGERGQTEMASVGTAPLTNAGERVQMSTDTRQAVSRPVRPEYPLLARQMRVEGAVVLQALIGKDGGIQNLHVLGGPTILAEAAREAVKQWRFKPYFQDGQPVETQAQVTVNFKIEAH